MNRRSYLGTLGTAGLAATAGCLGGVFGEEDDPTVLDAPEDQQYDSSKLPYPAWGQELPRIQLPDPLTGEQIDTAEIENTLVVTGFFATCPAECIRLIGQLAGVQHGTIQADLADEVTFLAITFDPQRDDAQTLEEYAKKMNIDMEAGNWHFLRPADPDEAKQVVNDKLGINFDRIGADKADRLPGYDFRHLSLTFLANPRKVVERSYRTDTPDHERVLSDVKRVATSDL
jgi:protein SCO1/2